jgi:hypothetical protein
MHYRTHRIDILEPVDPFLDGAQRVARLSTSAFEVEDLPAAAGPLVVLPAAP